MKSLENTRCVTLAALVICSSLWAAPSARAGTAYSVVETNQTICANNGATMSCPVSGAPFYGQDASYTGTQPSYMDNGDGTISDLNTGLMWVQSMGTSLTLSAAETGAANCTIGGYSDWRLPSVKELYSLIEFSGVNGASLTITTGYVPFIDTSYFGFNYGPSGSSTTGTRVIDCQDWSSTPYVYTTMLGAQTQFSVNFADGHIKGYDIYQPPLETTPTDSHYCRYVRGNPSYGINSFYNNGDGAISDNATLLMWTQNDSGYGMNWQTALAYAATITTCGYGDWRLPNAKELQSIVDYTRSPDTTGSAAIDPIFNCTQIINEGGAADYPFYWTGTTLQSAVNQMDAIYICFGRALGWMINPPTNGYYSLLDCHGAGAQRSDPKSGAVTNYYLGLNSAGVSCYGRGPQGDVVRIYNYVRLVRDITTGTTSTATPTTTAASTSTKMWTPTVTSTPTRTATAIYTPASTSTLSPTMTRTQTGTATATPIRTLTVTSTNTYSSTPTISATWTSTASGSGAETPFATPAEVSPGDSLVWEVSYPYPNPVLKGSKVSLALKGGCSLQIAWCVVTSAGRKVSSSTTFIAGSGTIEWDLRDAIGRPVANGLYYLRVMLPQGNRIMKLLVLG